MVVVTKIAPGLIRLDVWGEVQQGDRIAALMSDAEVAALIRDLKRASREEINVEDLA